MRFKFLLIILFILNLNVYSQIELSHNTGDKLINPYIGSCNEPEYWGRTFKLSDFGITTEDEFFIHTGNMGVWWSLGGNNAIIQFNIYEIDPNFPDTFSESNLIGSSQEEYFPSVYGLDEPEIVTVNFSNSIVVPANVEYILVEITKIDGPGIGYNAIQIAGTEEGNDFSWYKGCLYDNPYKKSTEFGSGSSPAHQYITVEGEIRSLKDFPFSLENVCYGDITKFTLEGAVNSVVWDFGDPASAVNNTSTNLEPTHVFSSPGDYEVSVTATVGGNTATETTTITIYEQPIAYSVEDQVVCGYPLDAFIDYDLTVHASEVLNGQDPSLFALTYYDGISNYNDNKPIDDPTKLPLLTLSYADPVISIININNPSCTDFITFNIYVPESPFPSQMVPKLISCDNNSFGTDIDGVIEFDLTQREQDILNGQSQLDFIVKYFTDSGLINEISNPSQYINSNELETVYVEVANTLIPECIETTSFEIEVLDLPQVSPSVELKQCDDDLDGFSAFNLNEVISKISSNSINETITFHESETDAENDSNSIVNPITYINETVSSDIVWARVENSNGCFRTSQVNLIVTTTQIPSTFIREFYVCDDYTDGISSFDFSTVHSEIEAMFPIGQQLTINYYRNEVEALAEENPIADISNYSNIGYPYMEQVYVRVDGQLDNDCLGLGAHINIYVELQPIAHPVTIERQCDDNQDGKFPFDVSLVEPTILNGQSLTEVTVTYFDENSNPLPSPLPNPFITTSQTVTVRVTNNNIVDGSCFNETTLEFIVDKLPIANPVSDQISCDDGIDDTDGLHEFDTSLIENAVLNGQTGMEVHYYDELGIELSSPLPNLFTSSTQTITVEVINPINTSCTATTSIEFIVNPLPEFSIETPQIVCSSDPTFMVVLDPIETTPELYNYQWVYEDGGVLSNTPTLTVSTPGTYSITLTKTDGTTCARTREIFVNASELGNIKLDDIKVVDVSNNNTITIERNNLGQGDYEFALDDEFSFYQDEPIFENVMAGIHTLFIRDKKGCGTSSIDISIIGFPKYFTPNGDGSNDTWQVNGVNDQFQPKSDIYIYDRYGKLLKQLTTTSNGWDGTFNGVMLPSDDYWFSVRLEDGRIFKGHFTLKR